MDEWMHDVMMSCTDGICIYYMFTRQIEFTNKPVVVKQVGNICRTNLHMKQRPPFLPCGFSHLWEGGGPRISTESRVFDE